MSTQPDKPETRREFEDRQFADGELADIAHDKVEADLEQRVAELETRVEDLEDQQ